MATNILSVPSFWKQPNIDNRPNIKNSSAGLSLTKVEKTSLTKYAPMKALMRAVQNVSYFLANQMQAVHRESRILIT